MHMYTQLNSDGFVWVVACWRSGCVLHARWVAMWTVK